MQPSQEDFSSIEPRLPQSLTDTSYDNYNLKDLIKMYQQSISKSNLHVFIDKVNGEREVEKEFSKVCDITDDDQKHYKLLNPETSKNRYSDIKPYIYNTVPLSTWKYINASYVQIPNNKTFIATQGPIDASIEDFWQMVFDNKVGLIVMLCSLAEGGRQKCAEYWKENNTKITFKIKVTEEKSVNEYLMSRVFTVTDKNGEVRKVSQLHFIGWPDHGIPNVNKVYETFVKMIKSVNEQFSSPVVVHCSAGVGRTGTFMTLFSLYFEIMKQIEEKKSTIEFNIFNCVRKLKERRMFLVENILQYKFVYGFICLLLNSNLK